METEEQFAFHLNYLYVNTEYGLSMAFFFWLKL